MLAVNILHTEDYIPFQMVLIKTALIFSLICCQVFQLMECVHEPGKLKGKEGTEGLGSHENENKAVFD